MYQFAKTFRREHHRESGVDEQLNEFLKENPNMQAECVSYTKLEGPTKESLFVVFRVTDKE